VPSATRSGPASGRVARPGQIRALGPFAVFLVPVALVLVATLVLRLFPCDGTACGKPYVGAWGLVLVAIPTALASGLPWVVSPVNLALALVTSAGLWFLFGRWAGKRVTEDVDATWWSFWREIALYAGGIVLGLGLAAVLMFVLLTFL
jgi:hypothetical protein